MTIALRLKVVEDALTDQHRGFVHVVYLEKLIGDLLAISAEHGERTKQHYEQFEEKYIKPCSDASHTG